MRVFIEYLDKDKQEILMQRTSYFSTPPVVLNLLIINGLLFLATDFLSADIGKWMYENLGLFFWESHFFKPHQLVTHMFMHGSFLHLFTNMFALWMFGRILETNFGSKRFLIFYFVSGIGAALLQLGVTWIEVAKLHSVFEATGSAVAEVALWSRINTVTIGASGAVFGILLGFGVMYPNSILMLLIPPIPMKAKYFVIIYGIIELSLGIGVKGSNIAHFAHVGGMLWGLALLLWWRHKGVVRFSLGRIDRWLKRR